MGLRQALRMRVGDSARTLVNLGRPLVRFGYRVRARISSPARRDLYMKFLEADRRAATRFLGAPAGFVEHLRGWAAVANARLRAPAPATSQAHGSSLRTKGIVVLGPVVP